MRTNYIFADQGLGAHSFFHLFSVGVFVITMSVVAYLVVVLIHSILVFIHLFARSNCGLI